MKILERKFDKKRIKKGFKNVLWIYDLWGKFTETKAARKVRDLAGIKNGDAVLDVACGTGEMLKEMVKQNSAGKNIGIDLSPDMIGKARKKLNRLKQGNFEVRTGNAMDLDFADNTFDVLINCYMVDLMPEDTFDKVAAEFYRVLKPGGVVVISTFSFGTKKIHRFWYWVAKYFPALLTDCRPVLFGRYLKKAGFTIEHKIQVSQNTFPSEVIKARVPAVI